MDARKAISRLLLAFVLISIGFALGKETAIRSANRSSAAAASQPAMGDKVIVYYMHQTFRCVTCNKVEAMTRAVLERDFAAQLREGRIEWRTVNFQEDEELARRYDVASNSVVVVDIRGGKEARFNRLDDVWQLVDMQDEFANYIRKAVGSYLPEGGK